MRFRRLLACSRITSAELDIPPVRSAVFSINLQRTNVGVSLLNPLYKPPDENSDSFLMNVQATSSGELTALMYIPPPKDTERFSVNVQLVTVALLSRM